MKNLEEMWTRIGSVTKNEVITAVLKDEIEVFKSRIEPHDTGHLYTTCLLYTSPSPRDLSTSRMPSSA